MCILPRMLLRNFPSFSEGLSLRAVNVKQTVWLALKFPFLFGGTFIEGPCPRPRRCVRCARFPFLFGGTFIEGASMSTHSPGLISYFPSFSEGLSLRGRHGTRLCDVCKYFPSFSEGLSLRGCDVGGGRSRFHKFPFLFGGTFIEGGGLRSLSYRVNISLPFRRDFH